MGQAPACGTRAGHRGEALSLECDDPQGTPQPERKIVRPREARDVFRQLGKATTETGHAMRTHWRSPSDPPTGT